MPKYAWSITIQLSGTVSLPLPFSFSECGNDQVDSETH